MIRHPTTGTTGEAAKISFRDVFAIAEFRALWLAQFMSVVGDQFARVALTVLVYDRSHSALFAAITFVASFVPTFIGGVTLAWLADRFSRRGVMVASDLGRCALVLVMAIPSVPLVWKVALLFVVTLAGAPSNSARAAIYSDVLDVGKYVMGTAITLTTYQFGQVLGFAAGGAIAGFLGTSTSLIIDAATFAASALIVWAGVRRRPAPVVTAHGHYERSRMRDLVAAVRLVFTRSALRTFLLFGLLAMFYSAPEGVVTPLADAVGGGAVAVGVLLAAALLGEMTGALTLSRIVAPRTRLRTMGPLAVTACAILILFFLRPTLPISLLILFASGLCASYQLAANAAFVSTAPSEQRSQVFGVANGTMTLGQGIVMILAGAAANHYSAALVIAGCGAVGTVAALALVVSSHGNITHEYRSPGQAISVQDREDISPSVVSGELVGDTASPPGPPGRGFVPGSDPSHNGRRYLRGQCPENIPIGEPFSLLASIVMAGPASAVLKPFSIPPTGANVLLVLHAPGFKVLSRQRLTVRVPSDADSEPVMFELRVDTPGPRSMSITAWLGGNYLGELTIEITAEHGRPHGPDRDVLTEIATEPVDGAVSLVVRFDPIQRAYRFEFRDEDNPDEVTSNLAYEPGPRVEQLIGTLDALAKERVGYSAVQTRDYLINAGAALWQDLLPTQLREQFWERQHRIRQLTILADRDAVPWELLYPKDPGHDAGFLVEQFPVTRAIFGHRSARSMRLRPARFVLPESSPPEARTEVEELRRMIDLEQSPKSIITALTPLLDVIRDGDFGLLHFACHNSFDPADGSSITLDERPFTPTLLTTAAIEKVLAKSAPTVFVNACRSAGLTATYNRLDGWATKFLEAGAAVFIGTSWAVSDITGREFAGELYKQLQAGKSLGQGVMQARRAAADRPGDPTWLAYTVYGDPRATVSKP